MTPSSIPLLPSSQTTTNHTPPSIENTSFTPPPGSNFFCTTFTTTTTIPPFHLTPMLPPTIHPPKIQLSCYDGTYLLDWLFLVDQFFQFYNISWDSRLYMTSLLRQERHLVGLSRCIRTINLVIGFLLVGPLNFVLDPQHIPTIKESYLSSDNMVLSLNIKQLLKNFPTVS